MSGNASNDEWLFDLDSDDEEEWDEHDGGEDLLHDEEDGDAADRIQNQPTGANGGPCGRTQLFFEHLQNLPQDEVQDRILQVLDFMEHLQLDLATLMYYVSWNLPKAKASRKLRYARTALMHSELLPRTLKNWSRPPRTHDKGVRTKAARMAMNDWAIRHVQERMNTEMKALGPILVSPLDEFTEAKILSIKLEDLIATTKKLAPVTWTLVRTASTTPMQLKRNKYKDSEPAMLMCICNFGFQRSQRRNLLQMILSIYFKASGTSAKALDTLSVFGMCMCQKSAYRLVETIADHQIAKMQADIPTLPFRLGHDNVNWPFKCLQEREDNKTRFDSGTAGTAYVSRDVRATQPDTMRYREQRLEGSMNPITVEDIAELDNAAAPRIRKQNIRIILQFLLDSAVFNDYPHKADPLFAHPPPVQQLPVGPEHITEQYMFKTVHIEEASLEGNERVIAEFLRQLGLDTPESQKEFAPKNIIPWIGDQLTTARIRSLKKLHAWDLNISERMENLVELFGWFHAQMAFEHSIHAQHYLTSKGKGLKEAFDLWGRKGLSAPSVAGNFHQKVHEALLHVLEARVLDLFRVTASASDITNLLTMTPTQLRTLAEKILDTRASTAAIEAHLSKPRNEQDDTLLNSMIFVRDMLVYADLDDAMRTGDVGRMEDLLPRVLFRYHGGSNSKYTIEILELLQGLQREWPDDLRKFVLQYCWLANLTGRTGGFCAFDLIQEHNIRDLKVIFTVMGSFGWDYIERISASIPTQRKVKDYVEAEFNRFRRGKSHTDPLKEADIANLMAAYKRDGIHVYSSKRHLASDDKVKDYIAIGSDPKKLAATIRRWVTNRQRRQSTLEDHELEPPDDTSL